MVEAADGGEGVAKAKSERPDLILMDIQLPILDGYETTRQIKSAAIAGTSRVLANAAEKALLSGLRRVSARSPSTAQSCQRSQRIQGRVEAAERTSDERCWVPATQVHNNNCPGLLNIVSVVGEDALEGNDEHLRRGRARGRSSPDAQAPSSLL